MKNHIIKNLTFTIAAIAALSAGLLASSNGPFQSTAFASEEHPVTENAHQVTSFYSVSPQISPSEVSVAASNGVTLIINNRPDGEAIGQPTSAEIAAAAEAAGITYVHIPVDRSGISADHIVAFDLAITEAGEGAKTLAFCRSGTRSILVRSYAAANAGQSVTEIISQAATAGYNIEEHAPALEALGPKD